MIARLKSTTDQRHPVLLDYTDTRGHKSVLPLAERIRALTDRLTFLITELDIKSLEGCFHDQDSAHSQGLYKPHCS
jgi:hypothetical protein